MAVSFEFQQYDPRGDYYESAIQFDTVRAASEMGDIDSAIELLYPSEEIAALTQEIIDRSNYHEVAQDRKWAVAILTNDDPCAKVAKFVENQRFSRFFNHHPVKHHIDYGIYDKSSVFITVIDAQHPGGPRAASMLRIVTNGDAGLKTVNTLSSPDPEENPWYSEISSLIGDYAYDENMVKAKDMITQAFWINPDKTWAIETMAVLDEYAGKKGELGEASFPLYAACLQLANRAGIESWISIQDLKPLAQMQDIFDNPWQFTSLGVKDYEGHYPTIPAVIPDLQTAQEDLRQKNPAIAAAVIDGEGLGDYYVMPEELQGENQIQRIADYYAKPL